jgi:CheY-like chemotaxis protein
VPNRSLDFVSDSQIGYLGAFRLFFEIPPWLKRSIAVSFCDATAGIRLANELHFPECARGSEDMNSSDIEQEKAGPDTAYVRTAPLTESEDCSHGPGLLPSSYAETILLVEDESFVREVTREVLQSAGYQVLTARNAVEASDIFRQRDSEIDLLLTDVILPGDSGRLLSTRLRQRNPGLKILFITGYVEQMAAADTSENCLAKPFSTEVLLRRVRGMLDEREFQKPKEHKFRLACGNA